MCQLQRALQHTGTHCNILQPNPQHTATPYNTLHHTAAYTATQHLSTWQFMKACSCRTPQYTASHCITLQHIAIH